MCPPKIIILFFLCSDEPLQLGEMYCIGITGRTDVTDWSGALRLGVTTQVRPKTV